MIYSKNILSILCLLNSNVAKKIFTQICPTMKFEVGTVAVFPVVKVDEDKLSPSKIIRIEKNDWDSYETSWDFTVLPIIHQKRINANLFVIYNALREDWQNNISEMKLLEEENNSIFIEAYGLQNELTPDVPLSEITLTYNSHYRYPDTSRKTYTDA